MFNYQSNQSAHKWNGLISAVNQHLQNKLQPSFVCSVRASRVLAMVMPRDGVGGAGVTGSDPSQTFIIDETVNNLEQS